MILSIFLFVVMLFALVMYTLIARDSKAKSKKWRNNTVDRALVASKWQTIETKAQQGESGLGAAINEADKLLDYVLKGNGYAGETLAERLKRAESRLSDKESVWRAHKLRNALAHEVSFDLIPSQGQAALRDFKRGLQDLGGLS